VKLKKCYGAEAYMFELDLCGHYFALRSREIWCCQSTSISHAPSRNIPVDGFDGLRFLEAERQMIGFHSRNRYALLWFHAT